MTATVTKEPPMERYEVRDQHGQWAANIVLRDYSNVNNRDEILHGGEIMINSDYGAYAYSWGNMGSPLKQFLCRISRDYIITKLTNGNDTEFDFDKSLASVKKEIRRMRKKHEITRANAQSAMHDLPGEDEGKDQFIRRIWDMDLFNDGDAPTEFIREREIPLVANFYTYVWIPFTDHLRTEIAQ